MQTHTGSLFWRMGRRAMRIQMGERGFYSSIGGSAFVRGRPQSDLVGWRKLTCFF
jgi:hypothetical protein